MRPGNSGSTGPGCRREGADPARDRAPDWPRPHTTQVPESPASSL